MIGENGEILEEIKASACLHHWIIESAEGPSSEGTCKNCGEIKIFKNFIEETTWNEPRAQVPNTT